MGRADLLIGIGGLNLILALLLGAGALWIGRRDTALIRCAVRAAPLAARAASAALPAWKLSILTVRRGLLAAEVALFGLVLGWGGLAAGVVAALGVWGFCAARAGRIIHEGGPGDPTEEGFRGYTSWALAEAGLVAGGYVAAFSSSAWLALVA